MILIVALSAACEGRPEPFGSPGELLFAATVEDTVFSRDAQTLVFSSVARSARTSSGIFRFSFATRRTDRVHDSAAVRLGGQPEAGYVYGHFRPRPNTPGPSVERIPLDGSPSEILDTEANAFAVTPGGNRVAWARRDGTVAFRDGDGPVQATSAICNPVTFSPDGRRVLCRQNQILDLEDGTLTPTRYQGILSEAGRLGPPNDIRWDDSGLWILQFDATQPVKLVNALTGDSSQPVSQSYGSFRPWRAVFATDSREIYVDASRCVTEDRDGVCSESWQEIRRVRAGGGPNELIFRSPTGWEVFPVPGAKAVLMSDTTRGTFLLALPP